MKRKVRKDYEQERNMSRLVRVWDSVRHAQAQGLARRIQRAAMLRPRHRAYSHLCTFLPLPKMSQMCFKNAPTLSQNGPKSRPGGALGASWAAPGSKTPPKRLQDASWAALGPFWAPSSGHGSNLAPKMEPNLSKNRFEIRSTF